MVECGHQQIQRKEFKMKKQHSIGQMIKRFIVCRNKSIKETAMAVNIKYTTFCEQLKNDTLTADTLFRLASFLDIDLNWMLVALGYHGAVSAIEREIIPRMQEDFRKIEKAQVERMMDQLIQEFPNSTADVRRELKKAYRQNDYYLLDVLVPDAYEIFVTGTRENVQYYVDVPRSLARGMHSSGARRKPISMLYSINQVLDIVIEERKERI